MQRHYYLSEDLDELEVVEKELEGQGVSTPQIHVLSHNEQGVETHNLHEVESVLAKDVVHSTMIGAGVGLAGATLVVAIFYLTGITATVGWVPAVFLALVVFGFSTWEGGLFGIQVPHNQFKRFENDLNAGKHLFFVDVEENQETVFQQVLGRHPQLAAAGSGAATPHWVVAWQQRWSQFTHWAP